MSDVHRVYRDLMDHPPGQPDGWFGKIDDGLYVGAQPYYCPEEACERCDADEMHRLTMLDDLGVSHLLSVADDAPSKHVPLRARGLLWHDDPFPDHGGIPPVRWWEDGVRYAAEVRAAGGVLYVHCWMGSARAPSMAYAILRHRGATSNEAMSKIRTARPDGSYFYVPDADAWIMRRWGR